MYLSGSVGYVLLKHKYSPKHILLLSDIHDSVNYCRQDSVMIDKWLKSKDNYDILLEEAVRENLSLTDLWPGAEHTQRLKELNKTNKKIKPIDIRPLLIPFSWELLPTIVNSKEYSKQINMSLEEYLSIIDKIFNYKSSKLMVQYIVPEIKKLNENIDSKIKKLLLEHFEEMKESYLEFREDYKEYLKKSMIEIYKLDESILEQINEITGMLMEWYILLLVLNNNTNSILHMGLAHSNRILDFLTEVYSFEIIEKTGINYMKEIKNAPDACLLIPDNVNSKYK